MLETIRDLTNAECVVPDWLHDVFLGYGDPGAAKYTNMPNRITHLDFRDTFLSYQHVLESFPNYQVKVSSGQLEWEGLVLIMGGVSLWDLD